MSLPDSLKPYQWLVDLVSEAGSLILHHSVQPDLGVRRKADRSPVTAADYASNQLITKTIEANSPHPILSEESHLPSFAERQNWTTFWLVDPLDGTRSFANGSDEYAICIALVEDKIPTLGCLHHPPTGVTWLGYNPPNGPAWAGVFRHQKWDKIQCEWPARSPLRALGSKHHASPAESRALASIGIDRITALGSALKFCELAEGHAHAYFRTGPTMEWDSAAGEALLRAAGGLTVTSKGPLQYNKPDLTNPGFLCVAHPEMAQGFLWNG